MPPVTPTRAAPPPTFRDITTARGAVAALFRDDVPLAERTDAIAQLEAAVTSYVMSRSNGPTSGGAERRAAHPDGHWNDRTSAPDAPAPQSGARGLVSPAVAMRLDVTR